MTTHYGCHNRQPFAAAQTLHGYSEGRAIRIIVPNRMAEDCQYTKTDLGRVDARCANCKHKEQEWKI